MCAANGSRSMKIDVCIARFCQNDSQACAAVERFLTQSFDTRKVFRLVSGGLEPSQTKCIQQYLGVELLPDGDSRASVYYRPIGLETEHLNAALHPRMCA
jgi:hypothetical protein